MSVLNDGLFALKYYFSLFCIFGRLVVSYVLKCGLFSELLPLSRYLWAFLVGQEGHISQRSNVLIAFRRPNIGKKHSLAFFFEFDWHTLQRWLSQSLEIDLCQIGLSKSGLILKTVATFVQKASLVWRQGGFLLRLFSTQIWLLA